MIDWTLILVLTAAAAAFAAFAFLFSRLSGWATLATIYPARSTSQGKRFYFQSGFVGRVRYNSILTIVASDAGLFLKMSFLFRPWHPPLLIPWNDLQCVAVKRVFELPWFADYLHLQIGKPPVSTLQLPARIFKTLEIKARPKTAPGRLTP